MIDLHHLPLLNAYLNGISAAWLLAGRRFILKGDMRRHRTCMLAALGTSVLFLISYLTYHAQVGTNHFRSGGWIRPVYFTILTTHTILAVAIVPLVLVTLTRALKSRFPAHRRLARVTWPAWMYVSVTGVLIYVLLYQVDPRLGGPAP